MADEHPAALTAAESARRMREGLLSSEELVQGCLERIRQVEPDVQAWTFLDEKLALSQAQVSRTLSTAFAKLRHALAEP